MMPRVMLPFRGFVAFSTPATRHIFTSPLLKSSNFLERIGAPAPKPFIPPSDYLAPPKETVVSRTSIADGAQVSTTDASVQETSTSDASMPVSAELQERAEFVGYICRLLMRDGEFNRAQKIVTQMFDTIVALSPGPVDPVEVLREAIEKGSPTIRMVQRRLTALKAFQAPKVLRKKQRHWQGWKWIVEESHKRKHEDKSFGGRLAREVLAIIDDDSAVLKKRLEWHRQAMVNRGSADKLFG